MSYYGASGSKHVYVATDQPLYGLGSEPGAPQGKRIKSTADNPQLMAIMPAIEAAPVAKKIAEDYTVACLGLTDPSNSYNNIPALQAFKLWQSMGLFVVLKRRVGASFCGMWQDAKLGVPYSGPPAVFDWIAYGYPKENIGALLDDPDGYVWGLPYGDMSWDKYAQYIPAAAGGKAPATPPPPKVVTDPPKVEVKNGQPVVTPPASESGISLVHVGLGALAIFLAWKLLQGGEHASYEANVDDFEENCWE